MAMMEKRLANLKCNQCGAEFEGIAWGEWVEGQRVGDWVPGKLGPVRDERCPECGSEFVKTLDLVRPE